MSECEEGRAGEAVFPDPHKAHCQGYVCLSTPTPAQHGIPLEATYLQWVLL